MNSMDKLKEKLGPIKFKAWRIYGAQKYRCTNKNATDYKFYGGKGISIEYDRKSFIEWYERNIVHFKGKDPTVGRIDHSKNYSLDNIEIQDRSINSIEMHSRRNHYSYGGGKKLHKLMILSKNGDEIANFRSINAFCEYFGEDCNMVKRSCDGKNTFLNKKYSWVFKIVE